MRIEIQILDIMNDGVGKMKATEFLIVLIQEAMTTKSIHLVVTAEVGEVVTVVVDLEAGLENILVNSEVEEIAILQQEEISGVSIEDRIIVEEDTIVTIMDLLEDIEKIEVHSEEEVVFEAKKIIADMLLWIPLEDVRIILMEIEKDLFKAGRVLVILEMKSMIIKGILLVVMTEMNLGMNEQEVLEEYDVHSEVDFEKIVVDLEVEEIVAQPEEVLGAIIADQDSIKDQHHRILVEK